MTTQTKRLLNFMRKNAYMEYNAPTLSRMLKIPKDKLRVYLNRLHNKGHIIKTTKGFYKAIADMTVIRQQQFTNPPTLLHGIMMQCTIIRYITKYPHGAPSKCANVTPKKHESVTFFSSWLTAHEFVFRDDNRSWFRYLWWEGRRVTLTIHENLKLDIYIACSKHPLSLPDFEAILLFLDGFFEGIAPFKDRRVIQLKEVAVAKDFKELRLDGVKSVSLRAFKNAWTRLYYKDDIEAVRVEHHLVLEMSVDEALRSLSILTTPVNYTRELVGPRVDTKEDVT